jgi:hypothetical protein
MPRKSRTQAGLIFYMKVAGATEVRKNSKKAGTL